MGYNYSDDIGIVGGAEAGAAGFVGAFALIYVVIMLLAFAFSIVTYILHSLGMHTIAERRGIRNPWLAWLPVANLWILGSISDQYQHIVKGKIKSRRKVMLGLSIAIFAIYFLWICVMIMAAFMAESGGVMAAGSVLIMVFGMLVLVAVAIALAVLQYMCLYDLYCSCDPNNSVLFLVLTILFSSIMPFFVFACRNKDEGMRPINNPYA